MSITKHLVAASCALGLVACIKQDEPPEAIKRAIPTSDQMAIKLPDSTAKSIGQLAEWYVSTRNVTRTFNGSTAWVLVLIHTVVEFPVTKVDGDLYTWGPWSGALDPAEYKLDVTAIPDGTYNYKFSGRSKTAANAQFEVLIDGTADPRPGELKGNGTFVLDFDAAKRVNPIDSGDAKGEVNVKYDLAAKHLDLTITSTDDKGVPVAADYAYNETADGGGDMVFDVNGNAGGTAALEKVTLRSRWLANGSGRADLRLSGGDLAPNQATGSECWDTAFKRVYYTDSATFNPTEGAATACAFATPDLPK